MARSWLPVGILGICLVGLAACGNESLLQSLHRDTARADIRSLVDGQVITASAGIPIQVNSQDYTNSDLELEITIYAAGGEKVWNTRFTAPVLNEPLPAVQPPGLAPGQYRLEAILTSGGEEVQKKTAVFFATKEPLSITGIKSFPPVITSSSTVMLKAVLDVPAGVDPYLRWSWRGSTIADGLASKGFGQVLWTAPGDEGVYTVTLELFPVAPKVDGSTTSFRSSVSMSTDVYVSAAAAKEAGELAPAGSYYALYKFQGSLRDEGGMKKQAGASAIPVGAPEIVAMDRGFGYTVGGGSGFRIPWFVLPLEAGSLRPFTLSLGVSVGDPGTDGLLVSVKSGDGAFSLTLSMNASLSPRAVFSAPSIPDVVVPSGATLPKDERHLLSLSFIPLPKGFGVEWFVDGQQTGSFSTDAAFPPLGEKGEAMIAGPKGFTGMVDLFAVYGRDAAGRPAPDPALFARSAKLTYGDSLVLAEGFDGISLPAGFALDGGQLVLGTVALPAGSSLTLAPLAAGADGLDARIRFSASSAQSATLALSWEGQDTPFLQTPIPAKDGELRFSLGSAGVTIPTPDGQKTVKQGPAPDGAALVVRLSEPRDAKSALEVDRVLVLSAKE